MSSGAQQLLGFTNRDIFWQTVITVREGAAGWARAEKLLELVEGLLRKRPKSMGRKLVDIDPFWPLLPATSAPWKYRLKAPDAATNFAHCLRRCVGCKAA